MQYFAVLDTNVLVSAILKQGSIPDQILSEALSGCIIPLFNEEILDEYKEVLSRTKFNFPENYVNKIITELPNRGILLNAIEVEEQFVDPDDAVFYQVVMNAQNLDNTYLITGNKKHFPIKTFIVTPHEMLDIINKNKP